MNFGWNLLAVATGFVAGVAWLWGKTRNTDWVASNSNKRALQNMDVVSFQEYHRVILDRVQISNKLYAIEEKADGYATSKHTVYRKVAREIYNILDGHDNA